MKDGWFKMLGTADEAFIRFLAKYLKERISGSFRVVFEPDRHFAGRPLPQLTGRVHMMLADGTLVASVSGVRYRHFQLVVETMEYRPGDAEGREYHSVP